MSKSETTVKTSRQITLERIEQLHQVFRSFRSHDGLGHWFRGQADTSWHLLPKAGRSEFELSDHGDLKRFNYWRRQAIAYSSMPKNPLEQLALAQHYGLATRLLDWSKNPLVACYFACCEEPAKAGIVYIYEVTKILFNDHASLEALEARQGVFAYIPNAIFPRVINQKGLFTVHCGANRPISIADSASNPGYSNLVELIIPANKKAEVLAVLEDYGIDRSVLFPDLEGLSKHINHLTTKMQRNV